MLPFERLAQNLAAYRCLNTEDTASATDAAREFLNQPAQKTQSLEIGQSVRLLPTPALTLLGDITRMLEYCLQQERTPKAMLAERIRAPGERDPHLDPDIRRGIFSFGRIVLGYALNVLEHSLHRTDLANPRTLQLRSRPKILKNLLHRLQRVLKVHALTQPEAEPFQADVDQALVFFDQQLQNSQRAWASQQDGQLREPLDPSDPWDSSDAPIAQPNDTAEIDDLEPAPFSQSQDALLRTHYAQWLWLETTDPLEALCEHISQECLEAIQHARERIVHNTAQPPNPPLAFKLQRANNPVDFWRLTETLLDNANPIDPLTAARLSKARFAVALREVNHTFGVDHAQFLALWENSTRNLLSRASAPLSRNHALLDTLKTLHPEWTTVQCHQWLEHLQSFGPGGYENSPFQEKTRSALITRLNQIIDKLSLLSAQPHSAPALERALDRVATTLFNALSGPSSQPLRRELRHFVHSQKTDAEQRQQKKRVQELKALYKWIATISHTVQDGTWFAHKERNLMILKGLLIDILQRDPPPRFTQSPSPAQRDESLLTLGFLKSLAKDNIQNGVLGRETLSDILSATKAKITQLTAERFSCRTLTPKDLKRTLHPKKTLELLDKIQAARALLDQLPPTTDALLSESRLHFTNACNPRASVAELQEAKRFWTGWQTLAEITARRAEHPLFQPSAWAKRMLRQILQVCDHNLKSKGAKSPAAPHFSLLFTNAIVPLEQWLRTLQRPGPHGQAAPTLSADDLRSYLDQRERRLEKVRHIISAASPQELERHLQTHRSMELLLNLHALDILEQFYSQDSAMLCQMLRERHRQRVCAPAPTRTTPPAQDPEPCLV